jgi:hypothetical protein
MAMPIPAPPTFPNAVSPTSRLPDERDRPNGRGK